MRSTLKMLAIAAIALAVAAGVAVAQGPPADRHFHGMHHPRMHHGPGMGPGFAGRHLDHLAKALELSAEQRASLEALHEELTSTVQPLAEQKHAAMRQLHEAIEAGSTDACAVGRLVLEAHGDDDALEAAHDTFEAGLVALLTPEQKSQYDAMPAHRPHFRHGPMPDDASPEE